MKEYQQHQSQNDENQSSSRRSSQIDLRDNRKSSFAQKELITQIERKGSTTTPPCIQGIFEDAYLLPPYQYNKIREWIERYRPGLFPAFAIAESSDARVNLNNWLQSNVGIGTAGVLGAQSRFEEQLRTERQLNRHPDMELPPTSTVIYGEENVSGALAALRDNPGLGRRQSRFIATTVADHFPDNEETRMNIEEFRRRGGELMSGVDVRTSIFDDDAVAPFNITSVRADYLRTDRGTTPSTAQVNSSFIERASEAGRGELSIPVPAMYGGRTQTRNSLYGSSMFHRTMAHEGMEITDVRPGPETELGLLGYQHRRTGMDESREGLEGKTMTLEKGDGDRDMDTGDW